MLTEREIQAEYPPVEGWRQHVEKTRKPVLSAIAAAALTVTLLSSATFANRDQIYGSLPEVAAAREIWYTKESQDKFADLVLAREAFGVKANQEIVSLTVDLVSANIRKYDAALQYDPEEMKSSLVWLPEGEFVRKYKEIQEGYGNQGYYYEESARMTQMISDSSNRTYFNDGYARQDLRNKGINSVTEKMVRTYKAQLIIDHIVEQYAPKDNIEFSPISYYNRYTNQQDVYREMVGLLPRSNDYYTGRFEEITRKVVAMKLLSDLPALSFGSYSMYIGERNDMLAFSALHQNVEISPDELVEVYFGIIPLNEYISRLGSDGVNVNPFQTGVYKIIDFSRSDQKSG